MTDGCSAVWIFIYTALCCLDLDALTPRSLTLFLMCIRFLHVSVGGLVGKIAGYLTLVA